MSAQETKHNYPVIWILGSVFVFSWAPWGFVFVVSWAAWGSSRQRYNLRSVGTFSIFANGLPIPLAARNLYMFSYCLPLAAVINITLASGSPGSSTIQAVRSIQASGQGTYPGIRAGRPIRAKTHILLSGLRAMKSIRAAGQGDLSGQAGNHWLPGKRANQAIRANRQWGLSGQTGKLAYPGKRTLPRQCSLSRQPFNLKQN